MNRIEFLGCPVDNVTMAEAIARVEQFIDSGEPHQIVPINAAKLWRLERDARLNQIVRSASLIIAEKAVVLGSRVVGSPLKAHVGGIMLIKALLPVAAERGYRVYFFGAKPEVVEQMVAKLRQDWPSLSIVGWHHGYVELEDTPRLIEEIKQSRPHIVFVAMGTPKQEYWIYDHLNALGAPVCIGLGGSFDVLAGVKQDTPDWLRALALEWLYRLVQDPLNLWKRYLITIPWFCYKVSEQKVRRVNAIFR